MPLATKSLFLGSNAPTVLGSNEDRHELVKFFWPHLGDDISMDEHKDFFRFIDETLRELAPYAREFAFQDFQGLFNVIKFLRSNQSSTRDDIVRELKLTTFGSCLDDKIVKSIELSVRLWLGLNLRFSGAFFGRVHPTRDYINWEGGRTLKDMVGSRFTKSMHAYTEYEFDGFSAAKLKRICFLQIEWTNYLNDHLKLTGIRGKRILHIYHQKRVLQNQDKAEEPIPTDLVRETLRSLELLLPCGDPDTTDLLKKVDKLSLARSSWFPEDSPWFYAGQPFSLDEFNYWKPRLRRLLVLFRSPPESFLQRLYDTRDIGQWAALWVGIFGILFLTLIFGILASVYAIKQYFLALESYNLSIKSYQLSLLLACQQNATLFLGHCSQDVISTLAGAGRR